MTVSSHKPIVLPIATIQHTLPSIASEIYHAIIPSEHVWLSCYIQGEPSVHGKIKLSLDDEDRAKINFEGKEGVRLERVDEVCIRFVSCNSVMWRQSCQWYSYMMLLSSIIKENVNNLRLTMSHLSSRKRHTSILCTRMPNM